LCNIQQVQDQIENLQAMNAIIMKNINDPDFQKFTGYLNAEHEKNLLKIKKCEASLEKLVPKKAKLAKQYGIDYSGKNALEINIRNLSLLVYQDKRKSLDQKKIDFEINVQNLQKDYEANLEDLRKELEVELEWLRKKQENEMISSEKELEELRKKHNL